MSKIYYDFSGFDGALKSLKQVATDFDEMSISIQNLSVDIPEITESFENAKKTTKSLIDSISERINIEHTRAENAKNDHIANENALVEELTNNAVLGELVSPNIYAIQAGDTLSKIAINHNVSLDELIEANGEVLSNPNLIYVGNVLMIPGNSNNNTTVIETLTKTNDNTELINKENIYYVEKGDNLTEIAHKFNVSLDSLIAANKGKFYDPNLIYVGTALTIPMQTEFGETTNTQSNSQDANDSNNQNGVEIYNQQNELSEIKEKQSIVDNNKISVDEPFVRKEFDPTIPSYQTEVNGTSYKSIPSLGFEVTTNNKTYTLTDEEFDFICAVVRAESNGKADDALGVVSTMLNRCENDYHIKNFGSDIVSQAKGRAQYSVYESGSYLQYMNGNVPEEVKKAVRDALNGTRNTKVLYYKGYCTDFSNNMISPEGNRYSADWH